MKTPRVTIMIFKISIYRSLQEQIFTHNQHLKTTRTNFVKRQAINQLLLLVFSMMTFDKKNPYRSGTETYDLVSHSAKQSRPFNIFTLKIQEVIPIDCPLRLSKRCLHLRQQDLFD